MSALVPTWGWYAAARFAVGMGFGANMVINCIYPLEFVGRQWRVLCGTIGFWSPALVVLTGVVSTDPSSYITQNKALKLKIPRNTPHLFLFCNF